MVRILHAAILVNSTELLLKRSDRIALQRGAS